MGDAVSLDELNELSFGEGGARDSSVPIVQARPTVVQGVAVSLDDGGSGQSTRATQPGLVRQSSAPGPASTPSAQRRYGRSSSTPADPSRAARTPLPQRISRELAEPSEADEELLTMTVRVGMVAPLCGSSKVLGSYSRMVHTCVHLIRARETHAIRSGWDSDV